MRVQLALCTAALKYIFMDAGQARWIACGKLTYLLSLFLSAYTRTLIMWVLLATVDNKSLNHLISLEVVVTDAWLDLLISLHPQAEDITLTQSRKSIPMS